MSESVIDPSDPFESPKLLIGGAKRHFATFQADQQRLSMGDIFDITAEPGDDMTVSVVVKSGIMPGTLKQLVFDLTGNLRSALDHAVFASTFALTGVEHENGTKFPLGDTEADVINDSKRGCRNVPADIKDLLIRFKVFRSGNAVVWALNKLRNTKSHRMLIPFATSPDFTPAEPVSPGVAAGSWDWEPSTGRLKSSIQLKPSSRIAEDGTIKVSPQPQVTVMAGSISLQILIGTGMFRGQPALGVFDRMIAEVERIVAAIEAETERLIRERSA